MPAAIEIAGSPKTAGALVLPLFASWYLWSWRNGASQGTPQEDM
jgi:hypothetical protein